MKQNSFGDTTRTAAATWTWYTLKGYSCDLDYMPMLRKFVLIIVHDATTTIPACPLLEKSHYNISEEFVDKGWKMCIIDLFL